MRIFSIFIVLQLCCGRGETSNFLDIENLPKCRTKQYSSGSIDKIIVFSAPRTGSSLMFNVFRYLFEHTQSFSFDHRRDHPVRKVLKTHNKSSFDWHNKNTTLFVMPIRNPLEAALSHARVGGLDSLPDKKRAKLLIDAQYDRFTHAKNKERQGFHIAFFKYELFENNLTALLDQIEKLFALSIDPLDRENMILGYSKENVALTVQSLDHFEQVFPLSGFHGNHICKGPPSVSKELLVWLTYYSEKKGPLYPK